MASYSFFQSPNFFSLNESSQAPTYTLLPTPPSPFEALNEVGPRVYHLENHQSEKLRFFVFGCQGEKGDPQKKVAELMNAVETPVDFFIGLGDNFYPDGLNSPDDERFNSQFRDIYSKKIPGFICLGNHDLKEHNVEVVKSYIPFRGTSQGLQIAANQVAYTYLSNPNDPELPMSRREFYLQPKLDIKKLPQWNMPYFFYSVIVGNVQFFFINSSTYLADFLNKDTEDAIYNQANWFETEFAKAKQAKRTTIVGSHHAIITIGKRVWNGDARLYLTPEGLAAMNKFHHYEKPTRCYNELLAKTFGVQGIFPSVMLSAHDHMIAYYNNKEDELQPYKICQLISGGGGGDLQERLYFGDHQNLGCYLKSHGVILVTCNKFFPQEMTFDVLTIGQQRLIFKNINSKPVFIEESCDIFKRLREVILEACNDYQDFLQEKQLAYKGGFFSLNSTHKEIDVENMHALINYLNQPFPSPIELALEQINRLLAAFSNKRSDHALYKNIQNKIKNKMSEEIYEGLYTLSAPRLQR